MKTNRKRETAKPAPPIDECVACGAEGSYVRASTRTRKDFRGESFTVKHHHWKCRECGVAVLGDAEMDEAMRATVAAYQQAHDLLTYLGEINGTHVWMNRERPRTSFLLFPADPDNGFLWASHRDPEVDLDWDTVDNLIALLPPFAISLTAPCECR